MALFAKGRCRKNDKARSTLGQLRTVMQQPRWANDAEAPSVLRKAEELTEGKAGDKKP